MALTAGTLLLTWWLVAAAYGPDAVRHRPGRSSARGSASCMLWGFTFALFYHLGNGIRHLAWDFGWGFELVAAARLRHRRAGVRRRARR